MKKLAIGCFIEKAIYPDGHFSQLFIYERDCMCMCVCCVCMYVKNKAYFAAYIRIHTAIA